MDSKSNRRAPETEGMIAKGGTIAYRALTFCEERTRHNRRCSLPTVTMGKGRHFRQESVPRALPRATFVLFNTSVFILTPVETT